MIRKPLRMSACLALMLATAAQAAAIDDAVVSRVHAPAEVESPTGWALLPPDTRLDIPSRVRTGDGGRLELRLVDKGLLTLGGNSTLLIHSTEPPDGLARRGLARLQLERGHLRVAAGPLDLWPPSDLRLNAGALRLRIFGAEIWADIHDRGDEICLLHGAVEIQTPLGPERLDGRGECLVWDGQAVQRLTPRQAGPMGIRLSQLIFPEATDAYTVSIRAQGAVPPPAIAGGGQRPTAPPVAAPSPRPMPPPPPPDDTALPDAGDDARWRLVLASLPTREAADLEAQRLRHRGLDTRIDIGRSSDGTATYRLTYGAFYTRESAEQVLREQRRQRGFEKAWLLHVQ